MDKKRFFINLLSNILSALSGLLISFFLTPYIVKTLGTEAYGFFPLTNNFLMFSGIFTTALNSMSGRFITMSLEQKDIKQVNVLFNSILFGNVLLTLFFILFGVIFVSFIDFFLDIPTYIFSDVQFLFSLVIISLCISVSSTVFSVSAFAMNRLDKQALINIGGNLIRLILILFLFWMFTPKLYFLGISAVVSAMYYGIQNYRLTRRLLPEVKISTDFISKSALIVLLSSGIWNSITALSNVLNTQFDLFIANNIFGSKEMGILSLTKFAPSFLQLLVGIVIPVFLPDMIRIFAREDHNQLKKEMDFSFKIVFMIVIIPMVIFFAYGKEFFSLWVPQEDDNTLYFLSIITLIPFLIHATIETIYNIFVITNKLKLVALWGLSISIVNFTMSVLLSKYTDMGILAIPLAGLVTGVISHLTFTPLYAAKCLNVEYGYFYKRIAQGLLSFLFLFAIISFWKFLSFITVRSWITFLMNSFISIIICYIIALFLRFDSTKRKQFISLIRSKIRI